MSKRNKFAVKLDGTRPDEFPIRHFISLLNEIVKIAPDQGDYLHVTDVSQGSLVAEITVDHSRSIDFRGAIISAGMQSENSKRPHPLDRFAKQHGVSIAILDSNKVSLAHFRGVYSEEYNPKLKQPLKENVVVLKGGKDAMGSHLTHLWLYPVGAKKPLPNVFTTHDLGSSILKYYDQVITIDGIGYYERSTEDGSWHLTNVEILSFSPRDNTSLKEKLKIISDFGEEWPEDIQEKLKANRGGDNA